MPTPRAHGGAALANFPLTVPGFKGLNTNSAGSLLTPDWATRLSNTVIDRDGRLAARKGWNSTVTTAHTGDFIQGIHYLKHDGTSEHILTTNTEVISTANNGSTFSDVTGTASFTDGNWKLLNFNDKVIGLQDGKSPIVYSGSTASHIDDSGNEPTGGVGTSAFGRLWVSDTNDTELKYCALLDETDWQGADTGSFDLTNVWPGTDTITAVAQHNNTLVVFGARNILIFADNTGSELGIDPSNMQVIDTIENVGCLSQNSVQNVNGDLWFISNSRELVSLQRAMLEQRSGAPKVISSPVSDLLRDNIESGSFDLTRMRAHFSPVERFYLLSLPVAGTGSGLEQGTVFVFDTRGFLQDGSARCMGTWNEMVPTVVFDDMVTGTIYMALADVEGELGTYQGRQDNGESYTMTYESGWLDIRQQEAFGYLLILKRIQGIFYLDLQTSTNFKWAFDFSRTFTTKTTTFDSSGTRAEFGIAEFGVAEFSGGVQLNSKKVAGKGTGEYIKVGVDATINGGEFAIQQLDLMAKVGRLA